MRVVHLSFSDAIGGAARGAYALHKSLTEDGVDSWMLVERKTMDDPRVLGVGQHIGRIVHGIRRRGDRLALAPYRSRGPELFSPTIVPNTVVSRVRKLQPDVVHLHWVAQAFVRPEDLPRFGVPIVWTLRDMWPFTGGCHVAGACDRYTSSCGSCPQLGSSNDRDLSRWVWTRKSRAWRDVDIHPVGMSDWAAQQARTSSLFRNRDVRVIENLIDVEFWSRCPQGDARRRFDLPLGKHVLLFVAWNLDEKHKGFDAFQEACRVLANLHGDRFHALILGEGHTDDDHNPAITSTFTGRVREDSILRDAYSAADVTVVPSSAEAFGKVAGESLACGTPCVVFDRTGLADVVDHESTGYVASQGDVQDLVRGIEWVLRDPDRWTLLSKAGREAATSRFSAKTRARAYANLYREVALPAAT